MQGTTESSLSPVYDRFFNHGGTDAVRTMTNFSLRMFNNLWSTVVDHMTRHWNAGRGKRSQFAAKDVLFMMLLVLKNGGMWDFAAHVFNVATPTFIPTILKFLRVAAIQILDEQVEKRAYEENMRFLVTSGRIVRLFPCDMYATDVTFQQSNRSIGNSGDKNRFTAASTNYID
uniref:Uncharacterized protein n=2 Tax=Hyaloperonospora arabidopsidis (strain Emoy2) TaxID=559515 RepID=M4B165_HYAAE